MAGEPILVVDDNAVNLRLVAMLLRAHGYQVHTAGDADTLKAVLGTVRPSVILMDIQLPGTDGLTLTRQLKSDPTTKNIPIVALTAYAMKGDDRKALDAGCDAYVAKPIDLDTLPSLIGELIAKATNCESCP